MNKTSSDKLSFFGSMLMFVIIDIGLLGGWVNGKIPWLATIVMLALAYNIYITAPRVGLSKTWATLLACAFYLSFLAILSGFDLKHLSAWGLNVLKPVPPFTLFIAVCLLSSLVLIVRFHFDLIFDRGGDSGYYKLFPFSIKALSTIKYLVLFAFTGVILSLVLVFLWNKIAGAAGWVLVPTLNLADLRMETLINLGAFWNVSSGVVLLLALNGIRRCLVTSRWDVFISYKSKNVDIARQIADRLIASGIRVWFAEYQILLVDRDRFQDAIDKGIRKCTYGIALTNDDYAESEYCGKEMQQLLQAAGPKNILEIKIPDEARTHQIYRQLDNAHSYLFSGNAEEMFGFISQKTGWTIVPRIEIDRSAKNDLFTGSFLGKPFTIDVSGWTLVEKSFHGGGPHYYKEPDGIEIHWNLQYGEEISREVFKSRLSLDRQNDRILYNNLIDYAKGYFATFNPTARIIGVHLVLIQGVNHFALTYALRGNWRRRYSIMLIDPATKRAAEFVFTFQCNGPFGLYCHAVDVMDDLVFSFKWGAGAADKLEKALAGPLIEQAPATSEEIVDPPPANQLNIAVSAVAQKEELTRAIASFEKALEISTQVKSRAALLFSLGEVHEKSGDEEKAIQCYAQSVENNPAQINSLHNIATIYIRRGEYRQALEHLVKVDKSYLSHSMINDIILCYDKLGEAGQADQWRDILSHKAGPFFG